MAARLEAVRRFFRGDPDKLTPNAAEQMRFDGQRTKLIIARWQELAESGIQVLKEQSGVLEIDIEVLAIQIQRTLTLDKLTPEEHEALNRYFEQTTDNCIKCCLIQQPPPPDCQLLLNPQSTAYAEYLMAAQEGAREIYQYYRANSDSLFGNPPMSPPRATFAQTLAKMERIRTGDIAPDET